MKKVVIIQARFGSTRLPGKILKHLGSQSALHHVLNRCLAIEGIDAVCCAIPDSKENDVIVDEAAKCDVQISRGSEADVLSRYHKAAVETNADIIIRVTSDCPLVDPKVVAATLELFEQEKADFASNNEPRSWPHGLDCEVFSMEWLDRANEQAKESFEREHVGPYIRNHPEVKKVNLLALEPGLEKYRWTLDTPEDFTFLKTLFTKYPEVESNWSYHCPLDVLLSDSDIRNLEVATHH